MATSDSPTNEPPATAATIDLTEPPFLTPQRIKLFGYVGAAIAVVALVTWFMITSANRKEAFAAQALEQARSVAETGNIGDAVQQFQQIATTYSGTSASYDAVLGMAQARLIAGQAELAVSTLEDFIASGPPAAYASPGNGLLGTAYENTQRYAEAKDAYLKASDQASIDFLRATLLLDAGRAAFAAGERDEAIAIYTRVTTDFSETAANSEAVVRLGELQPNG
jgi:tetratricopeptide (TPR) repeat protein